MSELIAVIGDIHANREALAVTLERILEMDPANVVCVGDVVGYGPEPEWCVDAVRSACDHVVCGNHEIGLLYGANNFSKGATRSIDAHRQRLMTAPEECAGEGGERWSFLKQLPARQHINDILFVHGSPANPVYEYLREKDVRLKAYKKLAQNFDNVTRIAFHGHTHVPGIITGDYRFLTPNARQETFTVEAGKKMIVNCGSVGAPRDGDPRASFVTFEGDRITFHRLSYQSDITAEKIRRDVSCDQTMAAMLSAGGEPDSADCNAAPC